MKKVIYTCLVGNYDTLMQPLEIDASYDYICFCNEIHEEKVGVWSIRKIPYFSKNSTILSRYVKILPHKVLSQYDISLYIDANIRIVSKRIYQIIDDVIERGILIGHVPHVIPFNDCIYDDIVNCLSGGKISLRQAIIQYNHLKEMEYPRHIGLYENNVIFRSHNDDNVVSLMEAWWLEFINYVHRDQFSLCYVYWKENVKPFMLFGENVCSRNCEFLEYVQHNPHLSIFKRVQRKLYIAFKRKTILVFLYNLYLKLNK